MVQPRPGLGYAMVAAAATLFAINGTVSKVILGSGISSGQLTAVRCAGAFIGLTAGTFLFLTGLTWLANRLTAWESRYRGLRMPPWSAAH